MMTLVHDSAGGTGRPGIAFLDNSAISATMSRTMSGHDSSGDLVLHRPGGIRSLRTAREPLIVAPRYADCEFMVSAACLGAPLASIGSKGIVRQVFFETH